MQALIIADNLTKTFGQVKAVNHISFSVARGEILGFLGPNGAGKTTTMRMLTGFIAPDSGKVIIDGEDLSNNPQLAKRQIGYLAEGGPLYRDMTVQEFLKFIGKIRGLNLAVRRMRTEMMIDKLQLGNILHQPIDHLSKGYKRRVALAQALLHDPAILILDEPTDGLDPNQKQEVQEFIAQIAADKAIIISTHILDEVQYLCKRAMILNHGEIVSNGTIEQLLKSVPPKYVTHTPVELVDVFRYVTQKENH